MSVHTDEDVTEAKTNPLWAVLGSRRQERHKAAGNTGRLSKTDSGVAADEISLDSGAPGEAHAAPEESAAAAATTAQASTPKEPGLKRKRAADDGDEAAGFDASVEFISLGAAVPKPGGKGKVGASPRAVEALGDNTDRPVWARDDDYHSTFHLALHQEVLDFVKYVEPTAEEREERVDLLDRLKAITESLFPDADLEVFGCDTAFACVSTAFVFKTAPFLAVPRSYATDLYLPTSDIDVCVMGSGLRPKAALHRLGAALRREGFTKVQ